MNNILWSHFAVTELGNGILWEAVVDSRALFSSLDNFQALTKQTIASKSSLLISSERKEPNLTEIFMEKGPSLNFSTKRSDQFYRFRAFDLQNIQIGKICTKWLGYLYEMKNLHPKKTKNSLVTNTMGSKYVMTHKLFLFFSLLKN